MSKLKVADLPHGRARPRVVYDIQMPAYEYSSGDDESMSVDRNRKNVGCPAPDCLSNVRVG